MTTNLDTPIASLSYGEQIQQAGAARTFLVALTGRPAAVAVFSPNTSTAYWDPVQEVMVISDKATMRMVPGYMAHEVLHALETTQAAWDAACQQASHASVNVCEDIRINVAASARWYRNGTKWIRATYEALFAQGGSDLSSPRMQVLLAAQGMEHMVGEHMTAEARSWIITHLSNVLAASSAADPGFIAAAKALDGLTGDKPEPGQGDGKGKGKGKSQGQQGQPGDGQGQQGQGQGDGDGSGSSKAKGKGKGKSKSKGNTAEEVAENGAKGQAAGGWLDIVNHPVPNAPEAVGGGAGASDNGKKASRLHGTSEPEYRRPERWGRSPQHQQVFDATVAHLGRWRSRLAEALMAKDTKGWVRHQRTGALDIRKIAMIPYGTSDKVFQTPGATRRAVNTAIDLVVDQSGSTEAGNIAGILSGTCASLAMAISRIPGTSLGVLLYDSDFCRVTNIQPGLGIKPDALRNTTRACASTNTNEAVGLSCRALNDYKMATRRICILLTDAQPPEIDCKRMAEEFGIEVHTIVVCCDESTAEQTKRFAQSSHGAEYDYANAYIGHAAEIPALLDSLVRALKVTGA